MYSYHDNIVATHIAVKLSFLVGQLSCIREVLVESPVSDWGAVTR